MDTKWNNMIDIIFTFFVEKKEFIIEILLIGLGFFMDWKALSFYSFVSSSQMIMFAFMANICLGLGMLMFLKNYLQKKYELWVPENELFYQEWKREIIFQEKRLWKIAVLLLFAAIAIDYMAYRDNQVVTVTVLIQFIVCQTYFIRFMGKELEVVMEQIEQINKQKIETALEIEKQSLEKVSRSDQLRIDLITNVSHDLKTPLTSMIGYLELIKKEELSDVVKDYIDVICNKTDKLREMIESLFFLAKASSGNIELHMEKFELNRLIEQIMADLKDRVDESGLQFVTQLAKENTEIVSDNMYFYRICQNLLENTLKYSAKGTRVFVKTYVKEGERLCLEITNTAGYFMDFDKEDIMERFVRGDKSRTTDGNGLGLAIVSTYAKALSGEFDIQIDCDQFKTYLEFPKEIDPHKK